MPIKKLQFQPTVNKESTIYSAEGAWRDSDKIRFRFGFPQKIGGWTRKNSNTFLGVCRSLTSWVTLAREQLVGVGTNLKYYIERGGTYNDMTPLRRTVTLTNPFQTTNGSTTVVVTDPAHQAITGDFVTFSNAVSVGGVPASTLNREFQITYVSVTSYSIQIPTAATSTATGGGTTTAAYQLNTGLDISAPAEGWGAGGWGQGTWGNTTGTGVGAQLRLWNHAVFGEDLIFGPRDGSVYYWDATLGFSVRPGLLSSLPGATDVPVRHLAMLTTESRFLILFGCNDINNGLFDALLIRWSSQELPQDFSPTPINTAGSLRLSIGSTIITAVQTRQEILVFTDAAVYSLQFVGGEDIFIQRLLADNITISGPNAVAVVNDEVYWMGLNKFYRYNGKVEVLQSTVREFVFLNTNPLQTAQIYAGSNPEFNEIWWHYPSANAMNNDRYVIYNYVDQVWAVGTMGRTAWHYVSYLGYPIAASNFRILAHEMGHDDGSTNPPSPIVAFVESADVDIEDGDRFSLVQRILPDVTFQNSTSATPKVLMSITARATSGGAYRNEESPSVIRGVMVPVEQFTGQVYIRVRGRQMRIRVESTDLGVAWQLGLLRVDLRPDGRR